MPEQDETVVLLQVWLTLQLRMLQAGLMCQNRMRVLFCRRRGTCEPGGAKSAARPALARPPPPRLLGRAAARAFAAAAAEGAWLPSAARSCAAVAEAPVTSCAAGLPGVDPSLRPSVAAPPAAPESVAGADVSADSVAMALSSPPSGASPAGASRYSRRPEDQSRALISEAAESCMNGAYY